MARHTLHDRLLEGFLWRLAGRPDADAFALRGGMLVRAWFPERGRWASDVDLVCSLPYDLSDMRRRMYEVLATPAPDGVDLDFERFRLDSIWPDDAHPGMRLFVQATVDDGAGKRSEFDELHVDFTFDLPIWPRPQRVAIRDREMLVCPPAMLIGRKLRVTSELGRRFWRPKDMADLWMMLRHRPPTHVELGESIERTFDGDASRSIVDALAPARWATPYAAMRWGRFASQHRELRVPRDIRPVVDEVRARLQPIVKGH